MRLKDFKLDDILENTEVDCAKLNFLLDISCGTDVLSDYLTICDRPYKVILIDAYKIALAPELYTHFIRLGKIENTWRD